MKTILAILIGIMIAVSASAQTCTAIGTVAVGHSVSGNLVLPNGACIGMLNGNAVWFDFIATTLTAGQHVRVTFSSTISNDVEMTDNNIGTDFVSGTRSIDLTASASGIYFIGFNSNLGLGTYSLQLAEIAPPDTHTLLLNADRFRVTANYSSPAGSGSGTAVPMTTDTGYFWFFSANNVEMTIKVVDGRAVNGKFWVFAAGMTNVGVVITVTDTQTNAVKTYTNTQGIAFQPVQDTSAF